MYCHLYQYFLLLLVHGSILFHAIEGATILQNGVSNRTLECVPLKDCFFYNQYVGENILPKLKTSIQKDIIKQACGFNADREVEKGTYYRNSIEISCQFMICFTRFKHFRFFQFSQLSERGS